jgi:RecB family exonuclease
MTAVTIRVRQVCFGRAAALALHDEIADAQRADAMAPVTVVVPRSTVGLAARRLLAFEALGGGAAHRRGLVNVRFSTLPRLAADLGANHLALAGGSPAGAVTVAAAARSALSATGSRLFAPVRDHPATVRAVSTAYRELRDVPPEALVRLASQSQRACDVVELVGDMRRRLAGWFDDVDVAGAAVAEIERDPVASLGPLGHVIAYLPLSLPAHHLRVLDAIGTHGSLAVLVGLTGVDGADGSARALVDRFGARAAGGVDGPPPAELAALPLTGTAVVSAPSADAEVLALLRSVMTRNEDGVPLERMAIVHGGRAPYPRLIHESLEAAGIPYNGRTVRPLAATVAGRVLLGLFELEDHGWRRDEVIAWLSTGPLLHRGRVVPAAAWDRISREAGIVSGVDGWVERLPAHVEAVRRRLADDPELQPGGAQEWRRGHLERSVRLGGSLADFVAELAARCGQRPGSWAGWVGWAREAMQHYLGGRLHRARWDRDVEAEAFTTIDDALGHLADLDRIEPAPDTSAVRSAIVAELDRPAPQTTRFGRGILVAGIDEVAGLDLDVLFVVGMNDGAFPEPVREDAMLPDRERRDAGSEVPLRAARAGDAHRDYLAALASAGVRVLSFPRGDQHSGSELRPSRWLLDTVEALVPGRPRLFAGDLASRRHVPGFTTLQSYHDTARSPGAPVSLADRDLRSLLDWQRRTGRVDGHPLLAVDPILAAGLRAKRERASGRFTRFDGNIAREGLTVPSPASGAVQSPTGLEAYAVCPRRYLFRTLLRIDVQDEPEAILAMSALDRGSLVHRVLERYVAADLEGDSGAPGPPAAPRPRQVAERVARISSIAAEVFDEFEREGRTGRPPLWALDRAEILADLRAFVRRDAEDRARTGARPRAVELAFGAGGDAVVVELAGGRRIRFRGFIDRIDQLPDGQVVVIDYKTGTSKGYAGLDADPVARGTRMQLPVYALAARARFGDVPVRADYWFVSGAERFRRHGFDVGGAVLGRFEEVLGTLVGGIEGGSFPGNPGDADRASFDHCRYCDFDSICPKDRDREWQRVRFDPAVAAYSALAEPGDSADATGPGAGGPS